MSDFHCLVTINGLCSVKGFLSHEAQDQVSIIPYCFWTFFIESFGKFLIIFPDNKFSTRILHSRHERQQKRQCFRMASAQNVFCTEQDDQSGVSI